MTQFLPPNLLALFAPRDPIPYKPPTVQLTWEKERQQNPYTGLSQYTSLFEKAKDTPPPTRGETKVEKKIRRIKEKGIIRAKEIEEEVKNYDPHNDKKAVGDAFRTLFVARVNYDTSESKLRREFDMYGPIRKISMVKDLTGKPRGYAFIEFEHERDMRTAYKNADGKKIDGRRVLVDVERGRTVKGWRPLRLGGGLGATRRGANTDNVRHSGRSEPGRSEKEEDSKAQHRRSTSRDRRERRSSRDREKRERKDRGDRKRDRSGRDRDDMGKDKPRDRDRKHRNREKSRERDRDGSRRKRSRDRDRNRDRSDKDKERSGRSRSDRDRERVKEEIKREPSRNDEQSETVAREIRNMPGDGSVNMNESYEGYTYSRDPQDDQGGIKQEMRYDAYDEPSGKTSGNGYHDSEMMENYSNQ